MKKFARFLGFLGFFVTLSITPFVGAWAIDCAAGEYLPANSSTCEPCPGTEEVNGVTQGVYCSEGKNYKENQSEPQGLNPCRAADACGTSNYWLSTPQGASLPDQCADTCNTAHCVQPNDNCLLTDNTQCQYIDNSSLAGIVMCHETCMVTNQNDPANYCQVSCPTECQDLCICPTTGTQTNDCPNYNVTTIDGLKLCGATHTCNVGKKIENGTIVDTDGYCKSQTKCWVKCIADGNPPCPDGTTCEWNLDNPPAIEGHLNEQGRCVDSNGNVIVNEACTVMNIQCSDTCKYWDEILKECVPYTTAVTYTCGNSTASGPTATCGVDYFVNRQANHIDYVINLSNCTPAGQVFDHWKLDIDNSQHSNDDRFTWNYTNATATFEAQWENAKLYVHYQPYDDSSNNTSVRWFYSGQQTNPPSDYKEEFTIENLPYQINWTLTRANSTFLGWCDEEYFTHLADTSWLTAHCHNPYTIPSGTTNDVYLYALWECNNGYTLDEHYQCTGDTISVYYVCISPINNTPGNSYNAGNATYGQQYGPVQSVAGIQQNMSAFCSYPGYTLNNDYKWDLRDTDKHYSPEEYMLAADWGSFSTPPQSITFQLSKDFWTANGYRVLYKCGTIDGNTVNGSDTADTATYGQPYYVATNVYNAFINNCNEPDGYVVDYWTFENQSTHYSTDELFTNSWNLPVDDHYFTAHWVQNDFVIILDSNINQNPSSNVSNPMSLYTRWDTGVYLYSTRRDEDKMDSDHNPLNDMPQKVVTVTLNGNGGTFPWNGENVSTATDDSKFTFLGFFENTNNNPKKYIYGENDERRGYITDDGERDGMGYRHNETWVAHWENSDAVTLPEPNARPGYTFGGWACVHEDGLTPYTGSPFQYGISFTPTDNATCTAQWTETCYTVTFNENGGQPNDPNGTHGNFYKKYNDTKWYTNDTCTGFDNNPTVAQNMPTKNNATFIGYYYYPTGDNTRIFYGDVEGSENDGKLTSDGASWVIDDNTHMDSAGSTTVTLYAEYECNAPYHLMDDGTCGACDSGSFYNPSSTNANHCDTCDQYFNTIGKWTSKSPYTWSVDQCYRDCGTNSGETPQTCRKFDLSTISNASPLVLANEQFVTFNSDNVGRQISFYGNEQVDIYACDESTGVEYCPVGLRQLLSETDRVAESMVAPVDFYDDTGERLLGTDYIIGPRQVPGYSNITGTLTWSRVAGRGQQQQVFNPATQEYIDYWLTFISYPVVEAPEADQIPGFTFIGYVSPRGSDTFYVNQSRALSQLNGNEIITNLGGSTTSHRNLYAKWTENCYAVTFNENGGTPSNNGTHSAFYKKHSNSDDNTKWYSNSTCTEEDENPTVAGHLPTKENATFIGYYDEIPTQNLQIFDGEEGNGALTSNGVSWMVTDNTVLFAHYECIFPYHDENGTCVTCDPGEFYDPEDPTDPCKTCNDILQPRTGIDGWTSREPYNWSVNQCYRECNQSDDEVRTCTLISISQSDAENHRMEQFLPNSLISGNAGRQISFYGNEQDGIFTCRESTGANRCPVGLLGGDNTRIAESLAAPVIFHGTNDGNETLYLIGSRNLPGATGYDNIKLTDGFAWSQVMGAGQYSPDVTSSLNNGSTVNYSYAYIIFPATMAPDEMSREHYTFSGYGYPETTATIFVSQDKALNATNAASIIAYANNSNYTNMSPIIGDSNYTRNLYAQYTETEYRIDYNCATYCPTTVGGTVPESQINITYGDPIIPQQNTCTCSGREFGGWKVSNTDPEEMQQPGESFTWRYDENKIFYADWGTVSTKSIDYRKLPDPTQLASSGNALVGWPDPMHLPTQFTCGDGTTNIPVNGQPQLNDSYGNPIGKVTAWCNDDALTDSCDPDRSFSNDQCSDKVYFAKWECTDPRYHLNEDKNDCVACPEGQYWNSVTNQCDPCASIGDGWTSNPPYNWSINQCYKLCNGQYGTTEKHCIDGSVVLPYALPYWAGDFLTQSGNPYQITFYGNVQQGIDVCNLPDVEYCPAALNGISADGSDVNKTKASKVTFKKQGNTIDAGTRYIVGFLTTNGDYVSNGGKFWSHIVGPGQQITENSNIYTKIIYPTTLAPNPDGGDNPSASFKGYYDSQTNGTQRVAAALELSNDNAIVFAQGSLSLNEVGSRVLYPYYCDDGYIWNGTDCVIDPNTEYTVSYNCGSGTPNGNFPDIENPVVAGRGYTVLPNGAGGVIGTPGYCTSSTEGEGFAGWKFSGNEYTYSAGQTITWTTTYGNGTLTATYTACGSNQIVVNGICRDTCQRSCTVPNGCPDHIPPYPAYVTCSYIEQTVNGYIDDNGNCAYLPTDLNYGQIINLGACELNNVECNNSALIWNPDPEVWDCVDNPNTEYTIYFYCEEGGELVSTQTASLSHPQITVPSNSVCTKTGHSYNRWKATTPGNYPQTLNAGIQYNWSHTHGETFVADWNANQYVMTLDANGGTPGSIEKLLEIYSNAFYIYNNNERGDQITYFTAAQLPTNGTQHFAGYKTDLSQSRVLYNSVTNRWEIVQPNITANEEWFAQWSNCNPGQYYSNGQCNDCPTSHPNSDPATATSIYDCYANCSRDCDPDVSYCDIPNAATYTYVQQSYSGNLYYPGNNGCQLDLWAQQPELNGVIPNCECRVGTCQQGYTPNQNNTACEPISWTVNYSCGSNGAPAVGAQMYNTAEYNQSYTVAYDNNGQVISCNPNTGYVLATTSSNAPVWNLNSNPAQSDYTGHSIMWTYIFPYGTNPTYTAQYTCDTANGYHLINGYCQKCPVNQYWNGYQCASCGTGQHVNAAGDGCEYDTYNVTYACGEGSGNGYFQSNGATYSSYYNVLGYTNSDIDCTPPSNKRFERWEFNSNPVSYYQGGNGSGFVWMYTTILNPTFTATYVDCGVGYHTNSDGTGCEANHYDVKYVCNNGTTQTYTDSNPGATYNSSYYVYKHNESPVNCSVPTGKRFSGWSLNTTPNTTPVEEGNNISWTYTMANPTLTANWDDINNLCQAILPSNAHATMATNVTPNPSINANGDCVYTVQCNSCIGESNAHDCYIYQNSASNNGQFTIIGAQGSAGAGALNNAICAPITYTAVYSCGVGTPTAPYYDTTNQITYGESYSVLYNSVTNCSSTTGQFNHWTFNGSSYSENYLFAPWTYHGSTAPTFTAFYDQCPAGQVLVNGICEPECWENCALPSVVSACPLNWGYPAGSMCGTCPDGYPSNATCAYNPNDPGPVFGYQPDGSNQCFDPNAPGNPLIPDWCNFAGDPHCPDHYYWYVTQCLPNTYYVTLNPNGGNTDSGFISKLYEKYTVGWSKSQDGPFGNTLQLWSTELPTSTQQCQIFNGYYNVNGQMMINANGYLPLPADTLTDDSQVWTAQYTNDTTSHTITFKCSNGTVVSTQNVAFGGNVTAPAMSVCPGEAFTNWVSTDGNVMLTAGTIDPNWQHCSDMTLTPASSSVFHVDLSANGGISGSITELWDAVGINWYKDSRLRTQDVISSLSGDQLPTNAPYRFAGYKDEATGNTRGHFSGANWTLPSTTDLSGNETWEAQWSQCQEYFYYDYGTNQCKECESTWHNNSAPINHEDCYANCTGYCSPTGCTIGAHAIGCEYIDTNVPYQGTIHWPNNPSTSSCLNSNNVVPPCGYCVICDEANGWVRDPNDCKVCIPSWQPNGHNIDLESHRMTDLNGNLTGEEVDPTRLYTWPNMGVYLDSGRNRRMIPNSSNPLDGTPQTYGVVRFNSNGGAFDLDGYRYENRYGDRFVNANFLGFFNTQTGSTKYINSNGSITNGGDDWGKTATTDTTWHAKWNYGTIGSLPTPTRPGYTFDGWYKIDGNQVYENTTVDQSMNVYARWTQTPYYVNLDSNGGVGGDDFVSILWEQYNTGWSTEQNGQFSPSLTLSENQRPSWQDNSKVFNGYWTSTTGGQQRIRANGSVIDTTATILTQSGETWYAQYVANTNTFTVTFRCNADEEPLADYTQYVHSGDNVRVPAKSRCPNTGYTFTRWVGDHNTVFTPYDTEDRLLAWNDVFANEDFTPNWNNGNVYHVTILQTGATVEGEVQDLYEKYNNWWALDQNGQYQITLLSGDQLPTRTGYDFGGFKTRYTNYPRGEFDPDTGTWRPLSNTEIANDEYWVPKWTRCKPYWYYDSEQKVCVECPEPYHNNETPESLSDCYDGRCQENCVQRSSECPSDPNATGFAYSDDVYDGTNYYQNRCILDVWVQEGVQQQIIPSCVCTISECRDGYHVVNGQCVPYAQTYITLNPNGGSAANPSTLYTTEGTGVYRDSARTEMMTPDEYPLREYPVKNATVTLNANGGSVYWGGASGSIRPAQVSLPFNGFYNSDVPGYASSYITLRDNGYAYITSAGQSAGIGYTQPHTWYAQFNNGSVDLPTPTRTGYTFNGWWTECDGGNPVSSSVTVSSDRTFCAHWTQDEYIVVYNCGSGIPTGDYPDRLHAAHINEMYNILPNGGIVSCSKPASAGNRAGEFTGWLFDNTVYQPGEILWTFTIDNPTFTANYTECGDGTYYANGVCNQCPDGYPHSNIDATSPQHCYKDDCELPCTEVCPPVENHEPGALACTYTDEDYTGTEYFGGSCDAAVQNCSWCVWCDQGAGYFPDNPSCGTRCVRQNEYTITLDPNLNPNNSEPNAGTYTGQTELYTIYNTGVYSNPARTQQYKMTTNSNPLTDLPTNNAIVTFICPECDSPVNPVTVDLLFNGYYRATSNNSTQYIRPDNTNGIKGYITEDGINAGKGYTDNNNTWYAHWSPGVAGYQRWPDDPTYTNACAVVNTFNGWWTESGTRVDSSTQISDNMTVYAHWCESCPDTPIQNGSCSAQNCQVTFECDPGYTWDETQCSCVPTTGLTLTYDPNGGMVRNGVQTVYNMTYNQSFTTLGGNDITKTGSINCRWDTEFGGQFPSLSHGYTYNVNQDTTLKAHWAECSCNSGTGVQSCSASVSNNICVPTFACYGGYVPVASYGYSGECNNILNVSCTQCQPGYYQNGSQCSPCTGNTVSGAGATQCESCDSGYTANAEHTQCVGNTITIDWDENGGDEIPDGSCTYGQTFSLATAPGHNNPPAAFIGWKLANNEIKSAGVSVMCNETHVGVTSGTSYAIQAQWDVCQCSDTPDPYLERCVPTINTAGSCSCFNQCRPGYQPTQATALTCNAVCEAKTFNVTYNCGIGNGTPATSADTAMYGASYTVKNENGYNCWKDRHQFIGWRFSGDNLLYRPGNQVSWEYISNDLTFTAQYSECMPNEILNNGVCIPCECDADDGASCGALNTTGNTCNWNPSCSANYDNMNFSCDDEIYSNYCTVTCSPCAENQVFVNGHCETCTCIIGTGVETCGETLPTVNNICQRDPVCKPHFINPQLNCNESNTTCTVNCTECDAGWISQDNDCVICPAGTYQSGNTCVSCQPGYTSLPGSTSPADCHPSDYTITYQANGGINASTGVLNEPVTQGVTLEHGFITKDGTIFTKNNSIITAWDTITGGNYPLLNSFYTYNTPGNTTLSAHWAQCSCSTDDTVVGCETSAIGNECQCSATCADGYASPSCVCNNTTGECTATCNQCDEDEVSVNGECVECSCTAGTGASCGSLSTNGNICDWDSECLDRFINLNDNCSGAGNTLCEPFCTECPAGWVSNTTHTECEICPAGTYQSGNTCEGCPTGYTSLPGSTSIDDCTPISLTIRYKSNNGQNQTYDQPVTFNQSFTTEAGTRFTYDNHIMTQWNVESGETLTFANGYAPLSQPYDHYLDTVDTTLVAQWAECTCGADNCTTYATNENKCACNATCPTGYTYEGCECDGTTCTPTCTLATSYANYNCGSGEGIAPNSVAMTYGATHTVLDNLAVVGCHRNNSTFAGWYFDGDQVTYWPRAEVEWLYTSNQNFRAVYCDNCLAADHCDLTIDPAGVCTRTCHPGYHMVDGVCEPNTYTNGITYKPNGGTPNQNYTQTVIFNESFTTLGLVYSKARNILTQWDVESGGVGTFENGIAGLDAPYTYKTDGPTTLSAHWELCPDGTISVDNECKPCTCNEDSSVVAGSCRMQSMDENTCAGTAECKDGYIRPNVTCDGPTCNATCNACEYNQISIDGACETCSCTVGDGALSCGDVPPVVNNTCKHDPTCKPGYANPNLSCDGTVCGVTCTCCPAGTYQDGDGCTECPTGYTSLPCATSVKECFVDPNSCAEDEHIEHGVCMPNEKACSVPDALGTGAVRVWNDAIGTYGPCTVKVDGCNPGYHVSGNACVKDTETCVVEHGQGTRIWIDNQSGWSDCDVTTCDPGYEFIGNACVECGNRRVNGEVAVSGYIYECEIAACMYQGQKYALQGNECVPICENASDETGTKVWDERTNKCIRTCNPGYKMW